MFVIVMFWYACHAMLILHRDFVLRFNLKFRPSWRYVLYLLTSTTSAAHSQRAPANFIETLLTYQFFLTSFGLNLQVPLLCNPRQGLARVRADEPGLTRVSEAQGGFVYHVKMPPKKVKSTASVKSKLTTQKVAQQAVDTLELLNTLPALNLNTSRDFLSAVLASPDYNCK